jgi:hypothetical protein
LQRQNSTATVQRYEEILEFAIPQTSEISQFIKTGQIMKQKELNYTTKFVNENFRIKVYGRDENGRRVNTLVGVSGIIAMIGVEMLNKFIARALKCMQDVCVCKLRRGLQVSLYVK